MKHPDFPMFVQAVFGDWDCRDANGNLLCWASNPPLSAWMAFDARMDHPPAAFDTAEQAMAYCVLMGWTQL